MPQPTAVSDLHGGLKHMELQRNIHISLRNRFVYFAVPKAANSTIKWLLQRGELADVAYKVRDIHDRQMSPLIAPYQLPDDEFLRILRDPSFTVFTCVRNPYSRLLSCFLDRIQAKESVPRREVADVLGQDVADEIEFADFIEAITRMRPADMNEHYRPQSLLTCIDWVEYDHVLRFEELTDSLRKLLDELYAGVQVKLPVERNRSPRSTGASGRVDEYMTDDLAERIRDVFAADFQNFGYATDYRAPAEPANG